MMNMKKTLTLAALGCAALLSACDKNAVQQITAVPPGAAVKFFNFGVNAPVVNFYADNTKMTAVLSATGAESTNGVAYVGVGAGGLYTGIAPGTYTLAGKIATATDKDLTISTVSAPVGDGKYYSFYQSGFYDATTKKVDAFVIEDVIPALVPGTAYVRFVNAISNSSPMQLVVTLQSSGVETPIGATVAYKSGGAFVAVPAGVYDLNTRLAGSSTNLVSRTAVSLLGGRVMTIAARGDITLPSSGTATNRAFLDNTLNR